MTLAKDATPSRAHSCGFDSISQFNDRFKKILRDHSVEFQKNVDIVGVVSKIDFARLDHQYERV